MYTAIPITLTRTWLPRCMRLCRLDVEIRTGGDDVHADADCIQHMQHTLSHLSPALTALLLECRGDWWYDGVMKHAMAALPPLSCFTLSDCLSEEQHVYVDHLAEMACHDTATYIDIAHTGDDHTYMELGNMGTARRDDMHHSVGCVAGAIATVGRQRV